MPAKRHSEAVCILRVLRQGHFAFLFTCMNGIQKPIQFPNGEGPVLRPNAPEIQILRPDAQRALVSQNQFDLF